jgi:hypothetical protein
MYAGFPGTTSLKHKSFTFENHARIDKARFIIGPCITSIAFNPSKQSEFHLLLGENDGAIDSAEVSFSWILVVMVKRALEAYYSSLINFTALIRHDVIATSHIKHIAIHSIVPLCSKSRIYPKACTQDNWQRLESMCTPQSYKCTLFSRNICEAMLEGRFPNLTSLSMTVCVCSEDCAVCTVSKLFKALETDKCPLLKHVDLRGISTRDTVSGDFGMWLKCLLKAFSVTPRLGVQIKSFKQAWYDEGITDVFSFLRFKMLVLAHGMSLPRELSVDIRALSKTVPDQDKDEMISATLLFFAGCFKYTTASSNLRRLYVNIAPSPALPLFFEALNHCIHLELLELKIVDFSMEQGPLLEPLFKLPSRIGVHVLVDLASSWLKPLADTDCSARIRVLEKFDAQ